MGKLYSSTALALVAPHYTASCIAQKLVPHLVLVQHHLFSFQLRYHVVLVVAYEVKDLRVDRGFGWFSTGEAAYASALWGGFRAS
jgi:hypothetical protein